jgi:hypothetical protein
MFGDGTVGAFTDHSADLALVTASMTLTKEIVSKMKAKAEAASPIVRPVTVGEDSENYVMFVGSGAFRDLKADMAQTLRDAQTRGSSNPLFQDGDLEYDGVVIRKIQEIAAIGTVGAARPVSSRCSCAARRPLALPGHSALVRRRKSAITASCMAWRSTKCAASNSATSTRRCMVAFVATLRLSPSN